MLLMTVSGAAREADIVVELVNNVGVNPLELACAKSVAADLLGRAGLKVRFVTRVAGEDSADPRVFVVTIDDRMPDRVQHVLGYALPYTERANRAWLNYPKINKTSPDSTGYLLGSVIAHELGHLLLRSATHGTGLMKAGFTARDIRAMAENRLAFSPDQAVALRAGLQARLGNNVVALVLP